VLQFGAWILKSRGGGDRDIWCQRARRGDVDRKKRAIGREMTTDFLDVSPKYGHNVFQHHLVGPGHFGVSGTVRRRRGNDVGSAACTFINWRRGARGDEDGRVSVGHVFDCGANLDKMA